MNRADAALMVAEKGLEDAKTALAAIEQMKTAPQAAYSFALDDDGFLSVTAPDGTTKTLGNVRGAPGQKGEPGVGKDGAPGTDGIDGRDGRDGIRGEPGRDASQIEILPSIDPARSYARGTCASHRGGLIRAVRTTEPVGDAGIEIAGWQVILEGIMQFEIGSISTRRKSVDMVLTSGKRQSVEFHVPAQIYRGVFREGEVYEADDFVTWNGSVWHAKKNTTVKPGNGAEDWQLAVKQGNAGRDGQAGAEGKRGADGLPGRNGRDKI